MKLTRKYLHKIEMELVDLCEDNEIMREAIINKMLIRTAEDFKDYMGGSNNEIPLNNEFVSNLFKFLNVFVVVII